MFFEAGGIFLKFSVVGSYIGSLESLCVVSTKENVLRWPWLHFLVSISECPLCV